MNTNKKIIAWSMTLIMLLNLVITGSIPAFAHDSLLNVEYDPCYNGILNDGIDETWYIFSRISKVYHIDHEVNTIKYYFELEADEEDNISDYFWTDVPEALAEEVQTAYANSMKKWNNVYFYSYNSDGSITKNKVINIVEGTKEDHNLSIYPALGLQYIATTGRLGAHAEEGANGVEHTHYSEWYMKVYIDWFDYNSGVTINQNIDMNRNKTGAHEIGHVLGLGDVDEYCTDNDSNDHHQELLMGYGSPIHKRAPDITYKDLAGVAITRGFHTDNDHKWLNMGQQSDGKYKLVCSICNGVRAVTAEELIEYSYHTYGSCNNEHDLPDGNMMAVASYGNKDYYKCKYCRYVAPFSKIVEQNYSKVCCSTDYHRCVNTVNGLAYEFYEPHTLVDGVCTECTTHDYNDCVYLNKLSHQLVCACGATGGTAQHYVTGGNGINRFVPCAGCGYLLDMRDDIHEGIMSITQVSVNGSYIRSDGIVVLVDEDIEAYLAGTLQFYHPEDVPVTQ